MLLYTECWYGISKVLKGGLVAFPPKLWRNKLCYCIPNVGISSEVLKGGLVTFPPNFGEVNCVHGSMQHATSCHLAKKTLKSNANSDFTCVGTIDLCLPNTKNSSDLSFMVWNSMAPGNLK